MSFTIKEEILESVFSELLSLNNQLTENVIRNQDFFGVDAIKLKFSRMLMEDIVFLNESSGNEMMKERHANMIIRDIIEQIIEFIYLIRNPNTIEDYMGFNSKLRELSGNYAKDYHAIGGNRFQTKRKSVSEMARMIGEKESKDNRISLYDYYQIFSEECHNSYFFASLDDRQAEMGADESVPLTEIQVGTIVALLGRFLEAYRE